MDTGIPYCIHTVPCLSCEGSILKCSYIVPVSYLKFIIHFRPADQFKIHHVSIYFSPPLPLAVASADVRYLRSCLHFHTDATNSQHRQTTHVVHSLYPLGLVSMKQVIVIMCVDLWTAHLAQVTLFCGYQSSSPSLPSLLALYRPLRHH